MRPENRLGGSQTIVQRSKAKGFVGVLIEVVEIPEFFLRCVESANAPAVAVDQTVAQYRGNPLESTNTEPLKLGGTWELSSWMIIGVFR